MDSYYNDIDQIRTNIAQLNNELGYKPANTTEKIKNNKGNVYALNNFMYKQSSINYRKQQKDHFNGKKIDYIVSTEQELLSTISKNDYCKSWLRLDKYQKKVKIKEYIMYLVKNDKLDITDKESLLELLFKMVDNNQLKNKSKVKYDKDISKIMSISCLTLLDNKKYVIK